MQQLFSISPAFITWINYLSDTFGVTSNQEIANYLNAKLGKKYTRTRVHDFKNGLKRLPDVIFIEISKDMPEILNYINYKNLTSQEISEKIRFYEI